MKDKKILLVGFAGAGFAARMSQKPVEPLHAEPGSGKILEWVQESEAQRKTRAAFGEALHKFAEVATKTGGTLVNVYKAIRGFSDYLHRCDKQKAKNRRFIKRLKASEAEWNDFKRFRRTQRYFIWTYKYGVQSTLKIR